MKKCLYCAEELEDDAKFCSKCGKPQTEKKTETEVENTIEKAQKKKPAAKKPAPKSNKKKTETEPENAIENVQKKKPAAKKPAPKSNKKGKETKPQKGKQKFNDFNEKKREVYENLKAASPNDGSCEDKDCGYNNCYALAMRIASGKEDYDSCPYIE